MGKLIRAIIKLEFRNKENEHSKKKFSYITLIQHIGYILPIASRPLRHLQLVEFLAVY